MQAYQRSVGFGEIPEEQLKPGDGIMAITLGDLVERLESVIADMEKANYGNAAQRLVNTVRILEENGITIHVLAKTDNKKVEENDRDEEED